MESGERFKKAVIGGFDKADVMNYFEKMQKRHREETASLKAEVSALRQSESGLRDRCGDQADTIAELTRDLQEARESAGRMEQELTALRKKAEELQRELSSQKALGTELQMKKNVLEENLRSETAKNGELSAQLSELSARFAERTGIEIGDLLIEAKVSARKIVEKAWADADGMREEIAGHAARRGSILPPSAASWKRRRGISAPCRKRHSALLKSCGKKSPVSGQALSRKARNRRKGRHETEKRPVG